MLLGRRVKAFERVLISDYELINIKLVSTESFLKPILYSPAATINNIRSTRIFKYIETNKLMESKAFVNQAFPQTNPL